MVTDKGFKYVVDKLISNGFKAYLVGGGVRDFFTEKEMPRLRRCHFRLARTNYFGF